MLGLNRSNLAVVKLVEEICDKDSRFYVSNNPKCVLPAFSNGLEAAISTALFEAILNPAYIFTDSFFEVLRVVGDEISLGYEFDDVKYLKDKKSEKLLFLDKTKGQIVKEWAAQEGIIIKKSSEYTKWSTKEIDGYDSYNTQYINDSYKKSYGTAYGIEFGMVKLPQGIVKETNGYSFKGMTFSTLEQALKAAEKYHEE
jgi:hypothetical protein